MNVVPMLLAGGIGERFWPMSRSDMPKQLLPLISRRSMLEETLLRIKPVFRGSKIRPLIVTSKAIAGKIRSRVTYSPGFDMIVEPLGKNTAPAVGIAAAWIERKYGDSVMTVLSADHAIYPQSEYIAAVKYAAEIAEGENKLVVFGIKPGRPDTGYGYIQIGKSFGLKNNVAGYRVKRFVEKPNLKKAETYYRAGTYFWNSGMFVWKTSVILEEISQHMPDLYRLIERAKKAQFSKKAIESFYYDAANISIDYGIMEHSKNVAMVSGNFSWDDVGSWEAVSRIHPLNERKTVVVGKKVYESNSDDSIIVNESSRAVAAIGLDNIVVVSTDDATLVIPRSELSNIKKHLGEMKSKKLLPSKLF